MKSKIKTIVILAGLFLIVSLFWVMIGSYIFETGKSNNSKSNKSIFNNVATIILVENVNSTIEYYNNILEFKLVSTIPDNGEYDYALLKKDNAELGLRKMESVSAELFDHLDRTSGSYVLLYFEVENLEYYYNTIKEKCEIISEMREANYGRREFAITDNNGYILTFVELNEN